MTHKRCVIENQTYNWKCDHCFFKYPFMCWCHLAVPRSALDWLPWTGWSGAGIRMDVGHEGILLWDERGLIIVYFFMRTKGRDHRGGRAVHGYSCCLSRRNFRFSLRPSAPTWQGFHKLSSTSKPQLVVLMISSTHLPNYPVKFAHRPGCSQSTPNCTFSVEHEWRTWGEVQPECVLVKGTAEDCLWALPRRVAVV